MTCMTTRSRTLALPQRWSLTSDALLRTRTASAKHPQDFCTQLIVYAPIFAAVAHASMASTMPS